MKDRHGFTVPDAEFLTDAEGLVEHLWSRIIDGLCLWCRSEHRFASPQAVQHHMHDMAHCRMRHETEADYEALFDFYEYPADEDDEGSDDEAEGGGETRIVLAHSKAGDTYLDGDSGALVMPDGCVAVSRQYLRYHKQYFRVSRGDAIKAKMSDSTALVVAGSGAGASSTSAAGLIARAERARAMGIGTRGNLEDPAAQDRSRRYKQDFLLRTGLAMNQIRRRYFRVAFRQ